MARLLLVLVLALAAGAAVGCGDNTGTDNGSTSESGADQTTTDEAQTITVPDVTGRSAKKARKMLRREGLEADVARRYSDTTPEGVVARQRPEAGTEADPGETVTLVVSKGAKPPPEPEPEPEPEPVPEPEPENDCHPSYEGACLDPNASDYDCEGGSGDGPEYVSGPVQVVGPDDFDLDRDGDGVACE